MILLALDNFGPEAYTRGIFGFIFYEKTLILDS